MPAFTGWENFSVIVGSSGAALTGLQFVVIALTVDVNRRRHAAHDRRLRCLREPGRECW